MIYQNGLMINNCLEALVQSQCEFRSLYAPWQSLSDICHTKYYVLMDRQNKSRIRRLVWMYAIHKSHSFRLLILLFVVTINIWSKFTAEYCPMCDESERLAIAQKNLQQFYWSGLQTQTNAIQTVCTSISIASFAICNLQPGKQPQTPR